MGSGGRKLPWASRSERRAGASDDGYPRGARVRAWIDDFRANDDGDNHKRAIAIVALLLGYACLLGFPLFFGTNGLLPGFLLGAALILPSGWWFWRKSRENRLALADDAPAEMRDHKWRFVAPVSVLLAGVGVFAATGAERPAEPTLLERIVAPDRVPDRLKDKPAEVDVDEAGESPSWLDNFADTLGIGGRDDSATTTPNQPTATNDPTGTRPPGRPGPTGDPTTTRPSTESSTTRTPSETESETDTGDPTTSPSDPTTTEPTTPTDPTPTDPSPTNPSPSPTTTESPGADEPPEWSDDYMEDDQGRAASPNSRVTPTTQTTRSTTQATTQPTAPTSQQTAEPSTAAEPAN
ncbi:hypothetical protein [uncultured Corynebacterium sp.]|uniref:hypothetical protein n=1 Tax=uncultured Corynebacterium sp. TaxID=159447 RepID=UPI0025E83831|nr:hypothetical protein [uncultured Corynebacterium sp.]